MKAIRSETTHSQYVVCERCNENNFDNPEFWGCPSGSCGVDVKGRLITTKRVIVPNKIGDITDAIEKYNKEPE